MGLVTMHATTLNATLTMATAQAVVLKAVQHLGWVMVSVTAHVMLLSVTLTTVTVTDAHQIVQLLGWVMESVTVCATMLTAALTTETVPLSVL